MMLTNCTGTAVLQLAKELNVRVAASPVSKAATPPLQVPFSSATKPKATGSEDSD